MAPTSITEGTIPFTRADLERLESVMHRASAFEELATPVLEEGPDSNTVTDIGDEPITRRTVHALIKPIHNDLSDLWCELLSLSEGRDGAGNPLKEDGGAE